MPAAAWAKNLINTGLRPLGVQLVRGYSADPAIQPFIRARRTLRDAQRAGLPVGEYIDRTFAEPGATDATVSAMLALAGLTVPVQRVCEIGPGSGRYMEKVIAALHPAVYEVYETAPDWLPHLRAIPTAQIQPCDGKTLAATAPGSVDLVHAQKVFVYLPISATASYLSEMARVVRPGGAVAFDLVTEECMDEGTVGHWIREGTIFQPTPRAWTIEYLRQRGLSYQGHHVGPMPPGTSELLVFRRETASARPAA